MVNLHLLRGFRRRHEEVDTDIPGTENWAYGLQRIGAPAAGRPRVFFNGGMDRI